MKQESSKLICDANEAVAIIAHKTNEVCAIYPITPASPMGEHVDVYSAEGKMNEGETSTMLGLKGLPSIAEELMIVRDLYLNEYTNGKLHIGPISSQKAVKLIKQGKKEQASLSSETTIMNLIFTDQMPFDKVDVIFLCMGHGKSVEFIENNRFPKYLKIIDLSHDFRLKREGNDFIYGLPELNRKDIESAERIANPGCFATALQLALLPFAEKIGFICLPN